METLIQTEIVCLAVDVNNKRKEKVERFWVTPFYEDHLNEWDFQRWYPNIRLNPNKFFEYYRMSMKTFDELTNLLKDRLLKKTIIREPISVQERISVAICFLATGLNFTLSQKFRIATQTIKLIVGEVCSAIWYKLQPLEMAVPSVEEWKNISKQFEQKTQFPNCIGALDGKHIRLKSTKRSKKNQSIILLAISDANYRFTLVNVEPFVRDKDTDDFNRCRLRKQLYKEKLRIPDPEKLPNTEECEVPFVFLGDESFALQKHILRPYSKNFLSTPKKAFNRRLAKARRSIDITFGIFTNKWKLFQKPLMLTPEFAVKVTKAACLLHNFVLARDGFNEKDIFTYSFGNDEDDLDFGRFEFTVDAIKCREQFAEYFVSSSGEVSWQYEVEET